MEAVTVNVRLDPEGLLADIDRFAVQEMRSRSAMIRVLLVEAVVARRNHETAMQATPAAGTVREQSRSRSLLREKGPIHPFKPRPGNTLKCETCGVAKGQHP